LSSPLSLVIRCAFSHAAMLRNIR